MKLLLPFLFFVPLTALSQKPSGFTNGQSLHNWAQPSQPALRRDKVKKNTTLKDSVNNQKTMTITASRFSGSMNAFGVLSSHQKPLQYNEDLNAVTFIHTKSPTYSPSIYGNANSVVGMISFNAGASWDSTCIWTDTTHLARNQQGGIYNPSGNTNISNSRIIAMGPLTSSIGNYEGNWYASKALGMGNNQPATDKQTKLNSNATASLNVHHFSQFSETSTDDGKIHSLGTILNDPNASSFASYGLRGAALISGIFSGGQFIWTMDSLIPSTMLRPNGSKYLNDVPVQA